MIFRLAHRVRPRSAGRDLYAAAVRQARAVSLYATLGAPDTVEGRFEVLTLHVILLIEALIARTIQAGAAGADPTGLASYVARCWDRLSGADTTMLLETEAPWPEP